VPGRCQLCLHLARGVECLRADSALVHGQPWPASFRFSSYARNAVDPVPSRDSVAAPSLCPGCRDNLSRSETRFIRRVLRPSAFGWSAQPVVHYGVWLPRFVASLAWRVLGRVTHESTDVVPELRQDLLDAREVWRQFALGRLTTPGRFELHMLPIVNLVDGWKQEVYAHRAGQMQPIAARTGDVFVWMKLPGVLCLGVLRHGGAGSTLTDTRLLEHQAIWRGPSLRVPAITRFLMFEELQRAARKCDDGDAVADGCPPVARGGRRVS
jgi:hypothetical protein